MTSNESRQFVLPWRHLARWDLKGARAARFRLQHPTFVPLGNFAEEATELVRPSETPEKEWPVYGVNNKHGVFLSHNQKGSEFNAPYKRIQKDWFFHNPTRANVGSLGRVHDVPADAITSPEYQVWKLTGHLTPDFVEVLIQTRFFIELIDFHRVGAVKERLFVQNLLEIPVPKLDPKRQEDIVVQWRNAGLVVAEADAQAKVILSHIQGRFFAELGLLVPDALILPKCLVAPWRDVSRWSVSYNQQVQAGMDLSHGHYPVATLGSVLTMVQYGTSERANPDGHGTPILRINNIKDGRIDTSDLKHLELTDRESKSLRLEDGDVVIIRTSGSRDLVGTCAVFHGDDPFVFASYLIRLTGDPLKVCPAYLAWVINSPIGRQQVNAISRQIMQNNINSEEIRTLEIPLPPVDVQNRIMAGVQAGLDEIADLRAKAWAQAQAARAEVERMIIGSA